MIRLVQRRLIVPRGDTGTFSIPILAGKDSGDVSIFTIFDPLTHRKIFEKVMENSDGVLKMDLTHGDTVNLPVGEYVWDIKFYSDPIFVDEKLVSGTEVDSYYSAFSLPFCEIRETGDNLLMADDAPNAKLMPDQINYIDASIIEIHNSMNTAINSASEAQTHASAADASATAASTSASAAANSAGSAELAQQVATQAATNAATSASEAAASAAQIEADLETKANVADLSAVAFSGDYTDLSNVPTDLGDFTNTPGYLTQHQDISGKANSADLATVATSGEYGDLLHAPTNVSSFTNDAGYLTQHQDISMKANSADLAIVATSGSYNDLSNKPFIPSAVSDLTDDSGHYTKPVTGIPASDLEETYLTSFTETDPTVPSWAKQAQKPTYTAQEVGALPNTTYIPNKVSDLQNDAGYLTEHQDISGKADKNEIPTSVSELENDAGYITGYTETDPTVPAWAKASTKPAYTAAEVGAPTVNEMNTAIGNAIGNVHQFGIEVVQSLPITGIKEHTVYFVPKTGETNDVYDEYIRVNNAWEMIGNTQIDLSNYATKSELPVNVSELTNDAGYLTVHQDISGKVDKTAIDNAGITNRTYTELLGGEFTVTTAATTGYNNPYVRASVTGRFNKHYMHRVTVNGTQYILKTRLWFTEDQGQLKVYEYLGNIGLYLSSTSGILDGTDSDVPFVLISDLNNGSSIDVITKTAGTYTISVEQINVTQKELPSSLIWGDFYVPIEKGNSSSTYNAFSIGINKFTNQRGTFAQGYGNIISNEFGAAFGEKNIVSGNAGYAFGEKNIVSGNAGYAFGRSNEVSGPEAFVFGYQGIANAENMVAMGKYNVAANTTFPNFQKNTAYKKGDLVRGDYTSQGPNLLFLCTKTHTSGNVDYISQDIVDGILSWTIAPSSGDTLFAIGNGFSAVNRSNALKVDLAGNLFTSGDVYIGTNANSTGGTKVLCEADFATDLEIQNIINGGAGA